jgi:hypothetical protein
MTTHACKENYPWSQRHKFHFCHRKSPRLSTRAI